MTLDIDDSGAAVFLYGSPIRGRILNIFGINPSFSETIEVLCLNRALGKTGVVVVLLEHVNQLFIPGACHQVQIGLLFTAFGVWDSWSVGGF